MKIGFIGLGGNTCANGKTVAETADIITMVPDTPHFEAALFSDNAIAAGLVKGKTVVDMSCNSPLATKEFAKKVNALGCDHLDAPVSGGEVGAKEGTLSMVRALGRMASFEMPAAALQILHSGRGDSIKPGDPRLANSEVHSVATPQMALEAAATVARNAVVPVHILGDSIEEETPDIGKMMGGIALQVARHGQPFTPPCELLSGGETTVTVRVQGRGGRPVEFLLSLANALESHPDIHALAGDTDGGDGIEEVAGAIISPDTLKRAWATGRKPKECLDDNDGNGLFQALGDSVVTGPTMTNVNDFRAVLITAPFTAEV